MHEYRTVTRTDSGGYNLSNPSVEGNLDIQYAEAMAMAYSTCRYVASVGGTTGDNPEVAAGFSEDGFPNY